MKLNAVFVQLKAAKPSTAFGQTAYVTLDSGAQVGLLRVTLPDDIPEDAIVSVADIVLHNTGDLTGTGSRDITARRLATGFQVSKATWNNVPSQTGTTVTETVGAVPPLTEIRLDVSSHVQSFVSGAAENKGWYIATSDTTTRRMQGATAAEFQPYLDLEYVVPGDAPVDLSPAAVVSMAKPVLTFTASEEMTALRVLIDAAEDEVTPDFDSGWVPATAGLLDLNTTAYAGLSAGATTSWAVQTTGPGGDTDLSEWVEFSRVALPSVSITAPSSTSGDKTPPITWTAADQVSWRAFLKDGVTGKVLADSGWSTNDDHDWTPPKGLKSVGDAGLAEVWVLDDEDRVATPGAVTYGSDTQAFALVAADDADGVDDLIAVAGWYGPQVTLQWTGDAADEWQVVRDDVWLERIDGTLFEWVDYTAAPRRSHTYQVLRVSDGVVSPNGPFAEVTPKPPGLWLVDPEAGDGVLLGDEDVDPNMAEQAIVHSVLGQPLVRRRAGVPPPSGTAVGVFADAYLLGEEVWAGDSETTALRFKGYPQGHVYRLVWADKNYPVTIGNMEPAAFHDGDHHVSYGVTFEWWHTGDEPWGVE